MSGALMTRYQCKRQYSTVSNFKKPTIKVHKNYLLVQLITIFEQKNTKNSKLNTLKIQKKNKIDKKTKTYKS